MKSNHYRARKLNARAPSLAIPGNNLFRVCPDDTVQGNIITKMMETKGVTNAIVFYRDDIWGNGRARKQGTNGHGMKLITQTRICGKEYSYGKR